MRSATRSIFSIYAVALTDLFAVSLFIQLINVHMKDLGASPFLIGVIGSSYGAVQLFSSPIFGWLSDSYGSKKILIFCLACTAVAYVIQGAAASLSMLLVSRVLAGSFKHTQTLGKAMASELAPNYKSHVLGNINSFGSLGFIIGPTIGSYILSMQENGFQTISNLAAMSFVLNIVTLLVFVKEPKTLKSKSNGEDSNSSVQEKLLSNSSKLSNGAVLHSSKEKRMLVIITLILRFLFSFSTLIPRANLYPIMEAKYGSSIVTMGYIDSILGIISATCGFAVGPIVTKFYRGRHTNLILHGSIIKVVSLSVRYWAPTFHYAVFSMFIQSAVDPFLRVGITALSLETNEDTGAILGLGQTATSLSRMLAPVTAGAVQSVYGIDGPNFLGSVAGYLGLTTSAVLIQLMRH